MADFQDFLDDFRELETSVFAFSTDGEEDALKTVDRQGIAYPVLFGIDGPFTSHRLGAFYEAERDIIQPCAFILRDGKVVNAVYSNGPVGRLEAEDAVKLIEFLQNSEE